MIVTITIIRTDPTGEPGDYTVLGAVSARIADGPVEAALAKETFASITEANELIRSAWDEFMKTEPECDDLFVRYLKATFPQFGAATASVICDVGGS